MNRLPEFWERARSDFRRIDARAKTDRTFNRLVAEARSTGNTDALRDKGTRLMKGHFLAPLWLSVAVGHMIEAERLGMDSWQEAFIDRALLRASMIIATKNESRSRSAHKLGSAHQRTRELRDSIEEDMAHFIHNGGADFDGFLESFPVYSGQFSDESNAERFHELKWDLRKC